MYFWLMGIMAVYNLLLYASIKDNTLLVYVAYVSSMTLFYLSLSAVGFQYFWPNSLW
ncbi:7TM diverse intracellular signaling domain-containing protein [Pseudoalteromonas aurantia]